PSGGGGQDPLRGQPSTQVRADPAGHHPPRPGLRGRPVYRLVSVRLTGRASPPQEPEELREDADRAAGLAYRLLLRATRVPPTGVTRQALEGALEMIAGYGGGVVEGYPEPADAVPAGFLFHGALSTFEQLGFERDRMIGK